MEIIKDTTWTSLDFNNFETVAFSVNTFPIKLQMHKKAQKEMEGTVLSENLINHLMSLPFSLASYKVVNVAIPTMNKVLRYELDTEGYGECNLSIFNPNKPKSSAYAQY